MSARRRPFTREFKLDVLKEIESGKPIATVCGERHLGAKAGLSVAAGEIRRQRVRWERASLQRLRENRQTGAQVKRIGSPERFSKKGDDAFRVAEENKWVNRGKIEYDSVRAIRRMID